MGPPGRCQPFTVEFTATIDMNASTKDRQIEDARRRSHAAKVGWNTSTKAKRRQSAQPRVRQLAPTEDRADTVNHASSEPVKDSSLPPLLDIIPGRSSDPFDALPIKMTPEINRIVSFLRVVSSPALFAAPFFSRCVSSNILRSSGFSPKHDIAEICSAAWALIQSTFHDDGSILAVVINEAALLKRVVSPTESRRMQILGMQMQAKCMISLRKRAELFVKKGEIPTAFVRQVLYLFCAACRSCDLNSARFHGQMLQQLLSQLEPDQNTVFILVLASASSGDLACWTLTRPVLDFGNWLPAMLGPVWSSIALLIPPTSIDCERLPPCMTEPRLRQICTRNRQFQELAECFRTTSYRPATGMLPFFTYVASRSCVDVGMLCAIYQDLTACDSEYGTSATSIDSLAQAAVTLTSLYIIRAFIHRQSVDRIDGRDTAPSIMPRLLDIVQRTVAACLNLPSKWELYKECFLGILFHGSLYERPLRHQGSSLELGFGDLLRTCLKQSDVTTWKEMVEIQKTFLWVDFAELHAESWFEQIVSRTPNPGMEA